MKTLDRKNDAILSFGRCDSMEEFIESKPSFVHIYERLSGFEVRVNIGDPTKFLKMMRVRHLNARVFFEN